MTSEIKTIPDMLVETRGNMAEVARRLGINRSTVYKYAYDRTAQLHVVVNGVFMAAIGRRGKE
ncbi:TPA: protein ninH [Serratia odorifera]|nr:protein ninH [Serratia odorifera]